MGAICEMRRLGRWIEHLKSYRRLHGDRLFQPAACGICVTGSKPLSADRTTWHDLRRNAPGDHSPNSLALETDFEADSMSVKAKQYRIARFRA